MASYPSVHALLHDFYLTPGNRITPYADDLAYYARRMLNNADLVNTLDRALTLYRLHKKQIKAIPTNEDRDEMIEVFRILTSYFEPVIDDLAIYSAFELFAKSKLLRNLFIIHTISKPSDLSSKQKKAPIHVNTVRAYDRKGIALKFENHTIGSDSLFRMSHTKYYPFGNTVRTGLKEIRRRRNFVHFIPPFAWSVSESMLKAIEYLNKELPELDK